MQRIRKWISIEPWKYFFGYSKWQWHDFLSSYLCEIWMWNLASVAKMQRNLIYPTLALFQSNEQYLFNFFVQIDNKLDFATCTHTHGAQTLSDQVYRQCKCLSSHMTMIWRWFHSYLFRLVCIFIVQRHSLHAIGFCLLYDSVCRSSYTYKHTVVTSYSASDPIGRSYSRFDELLFVIISAVHTVFTFENELHVIAHRTHTHTFVCPRAHTHAFHLAALHYFKSRWLCRATICHIWILTYSNEARLWSCTANKIQTLGGRAKRQSTDSICVWARSLHLHAYNHTGLRWRLRATTHIKENQMSEWEKNMKRGKEPEIERKKFR